MRAARPRFRGLPIEPASAGTGLLPFAHVESLLVQARGFWLSTTRPDGSPHAMPLWGVWLDGLFLFDTHPRSQKAVNLEHDARAVVHVDSTEDVVILEGTVDVDNDVRPERFRRFCESFAEKYGVEPVGAFEFRPRLAYAWTNGDFRGSATRYELD